VVVLRREGGRVTGGRNRFFVVDCSRYGMQSATEHIVLR